MTGLLGPFEVRVKMRACKIEVHIQLTKQKKVTFPQKTAGKMTPVWTPVKEEDCTCTRDPSNTQAGLMD